MRGRAVCHSRSVVLAVKSPLSAALNFGNGMGGMASMDERETEWVGRKRGKKREERGERREERRVERKCVSRGRPWKV